MIAVDDVSSPDRDMYVIVTHGYLCRESRWVLNRGR